MSESIAPNVTPEKIRPIIRNADPDQLGTLYRLAHHMIRGCIPSEPVPAVEDFLLLFRDGSQRQRLLLYQAAYHLIRKDRTL